MLPCTLEKLLVSSEWLRRKHIECKACDKDTKMRCSRCHISYCSAVSSTPVQTKARRYSRRLNRNAKRPIGTEITKLSVVYSKDSRSGLFSTGPHSMITRPFNESRSRGTRGPKETPVIPSMNSHSQISVWYLIVSFLPCLQVDCISTQMDLLSCYLTYIDKNQTAPYNERSD